VPAPADRGRGRSGEKDYSGTPLHRKLGIGAGAVVAFLDAPEEFGERLGALPDGVEIRRQARGALEVIVLFVTERSRLLARFGAAERALVSEGGLWVAWPKQRSRVPTDLDFPTVQQIGLDAGLVDNKSCAIDDTWTALRFVVRRADRPGRKGPLGSRGGSRGP
jgi:hypothetical protein